MITVEELAAQTGNAARTVRQWCQKLGYPKRAGVYLLDDWQVIEIKGLMQTHAGQPQKDRR